MNNTISISHEGLVGGRGRGGAKERGKEREEERERETDASDNSTCICETQETYTLSHSNKYFSRLPPCFLRLKKRNCC
jgi:hypothetical protein